MDVKLKIQGRDSVPQNERRAVNVETHSRRGDTYNIMRVDTVLENDEFVMRVPPGGRLMISVPEDGDDVVYDAAQGAAVRRSQQLDNPDGADDPRTGDQRPAVQGEGMVGQRHDTSVQARTPDGVRPLTQPNVRPGQAQMNVPPNQRTQPQQQKFGAASDKTAEDKTKAEAEARAKAQQQSGTGRPPGEAPPKQGSSVGSPPDGNEGKDQ